MSVLSDNRIEALLDSDELVIHPLLDRAQIKGAKIDLRLDNVIYLIKRIELESYDAMELRQPNTKPVDYLERHVIAFDQAFIIHPGEFALAPSFESVKIPHGLIGLLDGRSSLGRLGIIVHVTSGSVDPGFGGPLILELANLGRVPVKLFPLMRIASMKLIRIEGEVKHVYEDKYKGVENVIHPSSKLHQDQDLRVIAELANVL